MAGNPYCRDIPWSEDEKLLEAWREGKTGYPWIDACMVQLRDGIQLKNQNSIEFTISFVRTAQGVCPIMISKTISKLSKPIWKFDQVSIVLLNCAPERRDGYTTWGDTPWPVS